MNVGGGGDLKFWGANCVLLGENALFPFNVLKQLYDKVCPICKFPTLGLVYL